MMNFSVKQIAHVTSEVKQATDGYKTATGGALLLLFDGFLLLFPNVLDEGIELFISRFISWLIYVGITDKLWRNKEYIIKYIKNLFIKKQNQNGS